MADGIMDTALKAARDALRSQGYTDPESTSEFKLYRQILLRKEQTDAEAGARAALCRRYDSLYYPNVVTAGGADHWPDDPNLMLDGRVHVSINTPPVYVDIPADLQAKIPYINYVPDSTDKADQEAADRREKLFWTWWSEQNMDLNLGVLCKIKALYGASAVRPYWDGAAKSPAVSIVQAPEYLRIGWGKSDYSRKDWALHCYGITPQAAEEEWNVKVDLKSINGQEMAIISGIGDHDDPLDQWPTSTTSPLKTAYERLQVTVYDYWYKVRAGNSTEVWNAVFVGNFLIENKRHAEYVGEIPYVWIPNGVVPGRPYGASELYGPEHIFREKDERISQLGQVIHRALTGQMWQLVGPDAPDSVPTGAKPEPNKVATPGPNARVEAITPWLPEFQGEQYLKRLDDELEKMTGLSPLMMGLLGSNVPGSSKAINAAIAMYAPRIETKRQLLYKGIQELWRMTARLWEAKDPDVKEILDGHYRLDIRAPEITIRDDAEQAQRAVSLVQSRIWSIRRAMDAVGVDNVSEEINAVMEEQTNAVLNPGAVMTQMQELQMAQAMGFATPNQAAQQGPPSLTQQAIASLGQSQNAQRTLNPPPGGTASANSPGAATTEQTPANALGPNGAPAAMPELTSQTMLAQNGQTTGRVLAQQKIGG
jgi:hypothetical protein